MQLVWRFVRNSSSFLFTALKTVVDPGQVNDLISPKMIRMLTETLVKMFTVQIAVCNC